MTHDEILAALRERFGPDEVPASSFQDNRRVIVSPDRVYDALQFLKERCGFDMLVDVTAVDYLRYPNARDRFGVIYSLVDTASGTRLFVKTYLNEPDLKLTSVYSLWKTADWTEREVYDMFGITFEGHPNLRRILLPEEYTSFPLRKDYPLRGKGERHNFPVITRAEG
jgi:NADH-quinone oxidoreductase subunit C